MVRLNAPSIEGAFRLQTEKNYLPDLNLGNVHEQTDKYKSCLCETPFTRSLSSLCVKRPKVQHRFGQGNLAGLEPLTNLEDEIIITLSVTHKLINQLNRFPYRCIIGGILQNHHFEYTAPRV